MRKPSEYVAAAVARVRSCLMDDCALTLSHGADEGTVVRTGTEERGADGLSGDMPAESIRVLALASDFPSISKGDVATLNDDLRIVTSVRTDASGASAYVGLSQALSKCDASVVGVRGSRSIRFSIGLLAVDGGLAQDVTDGFSPTLVHAWTLCIACDEWPESGGPQIGDEIKFENHGADVRVKASRVDVRDGRYVVNARSR